MKSKVWTKKCVKCGKEKPYSEFYTEGTSRKCKECVKEDARTRYEIMSKDENWIEKERERGREKYRRLGYKDIYKMAHPETKTVSAYIKRRVSIPETHEIHHWNYNLLYDVFILDKRIHSRFHKKVLFNEESKCFLYNGEILDTKEKHEKAIRKILGLTDEEQIIKFKKE